MTDFETVIGLEIHCALKSKTKVFSPAKNEYSDIPNSNVKEIELSFPGVLPLVNKEAVNMAAKIALILGCKVPDELIFDRKNYYYPDLPKGYQITQITKPIGTDGIVHLYHNGKDFDVDIHDIHLEEDTASLDHYSNYTLIDYNRCGVPLAEIVTNPCFNSAEEVITFLEFLTYSLRYTNISDADIRKGELRCDVNINLRNNGKFITPKVEIKNINSFNNIINAINYEIKRQTLAYINGEKLYQETRRYDEQTNTTITMRVKENAVDYKYFIEPNIPKIKITEEFIKNVKDNIPELPNQKFKRLILKDNLSENDAKLLIKDLNLANYYDECVKLGITPKTAFNWISSQIIGYINKENIKISDLFITPKRLKDIIYLIENGKISSKQGKDLFALALNEKEEIDVLVDKYDMIQISNDDELISIIDNILSSNPNLITDYQNGKSNIFGFIVGSVMKETKGKANPIKVNEILKEKLK